MTAHSDLGFGLGLRTDHYEEILESRPRVDWFEALSENYLVPGGKPLHYLDRIRADFPMVLHGVSLSIGVPRSCSCSQCGLRGFGRQRPCDASAMSRFLAMFDQFRPLSGLWHLASLVRWQALQAVVIQA